ncbi:MAG: hypothetical protein AAGI53_11805 [Planctomycetota bacterium]
MNQARRTVFGKPTTWQRVLETAALPGPVDGVIQRIIRKTRALPFERAAFATELVAHCQDGLAAGVEPDELAKGLGRPSKVGKLAGRAIRGKRPPIVKSLLATTTVGRRTAAVLGPIYAVLAVWFFARSPDVTVDYVAQINASVVSIPSVDRAAPLVADVANRTLVLRDEAVRERRHEGWNLIDPGSSDAWLRHWPTAHLTDLNAPDEPELSLLGRAAGIVETAHKAAQRPRLGHAMTGAGGTARLSIASMIPVVDDYRKVAFLLARDSRAATLRSDHAQLTESLVAVLSLAKQLSQDAPTLYGKSSGWHVLQIATHEIRRTLALYPDLLGESDLERVASALDFDVDASAEDDRKILHDRLQRTFAPGPNGRLTLDGWRWFVSHPDMIRYRGADVLIAPLAALTLPTRSEVLDRCDTAFDAFERWQGMTVIGQESWRDVYATFPTPRRFQEDPIAAMLLQSTEYYLVEAQRTRTHQEAIQAAVAAYRYRASFGAFAEDACDLVPEFLEQVPTDRFTGDPIRYVLSDWGPQIYVCGADQDDDGGMPSVDGEQPFGVASFHADSPQNARNGDWMLYEALERSQQ